jgi:hypothetical protein
MILLEREEREGLSPLVEKSGEESPSKQGVLRDLRQPRSAQALSPGSEASNGAGFPKPTKPHKFPQFTT